MGQQAFRARRDAAVVVIDSETGEQAEPVLIDRRSGRLLVGTGVSVSARAGGR